MEITLSHWQPYLTLISAVLSVGTLAFIIQLFGALEKTFAHRVEAIKDQKGVTEERLRLANEDLMRAQNQVVQLQTILKEQNVSVSGMVSNIASSHLKEDITDAVRQVMKEVSHSAISTAISDPNQYLQLANGFAVLSDWPSAAEYYSLYLNHNPTNWEVHFLCAVAYANSRAGEKTNLLALKFNGNAITYIPTGVDPNMLARLYSYRGAILKRLRRLQEAETTLLLAQSYASAKYEIDDIHYNLACVYAMSNKKEQMLQHLEPLVSDFPWKLAIRDKGEYFSKFSHDSDFRKLIAL